MRFGSYSLVISFVVVLTAGYARGQSAVANVPNRTTQIFECTKRIDAADWKLLLDQMKATNPDAVKRLRADPEFKKSQIENIRQLLAFACQAIKDGVLNDLVNRGELENIRFEIAAVTYDKIKNKQANPTQFASISDQRIADFFKLSGNEAKFNEFLNIKLALLKRAGAGAANKEITVEEKEQAKQIFAKIRISEADSRLKSQAIEPNFWARVGFTVKLQQAQFLARIFSDTIAGKTSVSDAEIDKYVAGHPELGLAEKRSKAEMVLKKAKAGEDFAALANQFTDDPGNIGVDGKPSGGLYADVPKGRMVPPFEAAALSLTPGEVSPTLVETDFGYHIIKLDKKIQAKQPVGTAELRYDVRHILISTGVKNPENPSGRDIPFKEFIRNKLETQKERDIIAKIEADNPIQIADIPAETAPVKHPVTHRRVRRSN